MLSSKEGFAAKTGIWHQVGYKYFLDTFYIFMLLLFFVFVFLSFSLFVFLLIPTCFTHCYLSHLPFILLFFFFFSHSFLPKFGHLLPFLFTLKKNSFSPFHTCPYPIFFQASSMHKSAVHYNLRSKSKPKQIGTWTSISCQPPRHLWTVRSDKNSTLHHHR